MHRLRCSARRAAALGILSLVAACVSGGASAPPEPAPAAGAADAEPAAADTLVRLLDTERLSSEREARVLSLDSSEDPLPNRLNRIARDPEAPTYARGNALLLLGGLGGIDHLAAFAIALQSEDARLRAAAAAGLEHLMPRDEERVARLLARALKDEDTWVHARALQSLGSWHAETLRDYIPRAPNAELRGIAESLLRVAEERGAPLSAAMARGEAVPDTLERVSSEGVRLRFVADRRWPEWGMAAGRLEVARPGGGFAAIASGVEVVAGVVPAFFSPDERWLVYEAEREIRVRDVETGVERRIGPGVAPRALPFSDAFVFLRQQGTTDRRDEIEIRYEVLRAAFAGGEPEPVGSLTARSSQRRFGNASPVRWMRVLETDGEFFIAGEHVDRFALPSPFGATAATR